ncbi:MAG: SAP domain-containing protein, partial [Lachnospiraceae bacterium]|nr:SAP domain-containing protein [Lachnospiraceae bacterium]
MKKPDFDNIKTYEEFKRYKWDRTELSNICIEHDLLFLGSEKKLSKVIEAYFNGEVITPHRNWYKNKVLLRYVNEEGSTL